MYITLGTLFMLLPWLTSLLLLIWVDENEAGAVRLFGLAVIVVGYFYCQAARSCPLNAIENLVAETSFDRCTFVLFFTLVFLFEMIMKLTGFGFKKYVSDSFNIFDAFIVIMSLVELFMPGEDSSLSVLRAFRLLRIFKIVKSWKSLKKLLKTVL